MNSPILIVEDNPINQRLLELMFKHLGIETKTVNNGLDAVRAMESSDYGIVMMDIEMPIMNGIDATRRIRETLPQERQPSIIAVTASTITSTTCIEAGMNDHMTKPVDMRKLRHLLATQIKQPMIA